jgi:hypothetical protein
VVYAIAVIAMYTSVEVLGGPVDVVRRAAGTLRRMWDFGIHLFGVAAARRASGLTLRDLGMPNGCTE